MSEGDLPGHQRQAASPVFIVGSPRSGTSALIDTLFNGGYHGFREGHFLSLLRGFDELIERQFRNFANGNKQELMSNVDQAGFRSALLGVMRQTMEAQHQRTPWVDKTGGAEMIYSIPQLVATWPAARFIFAKRRALENIVSRLRKFPQHNFEYHCRDWAATMAAWRKIRAHPGLVAIEIDQHELIAQPEVEAARLADFLHLDDPGRERMAQILRHNRPQETSPGTASRALDFAALPWNEHQRATFERLCAEEMRAYGYGLAKSYYAA